jgi:acyl-CoA reductase-like NAD-dependent aldehyde dehydrogenase
VIGNGLILLCMLGVINFLPSSGPVFGKAVTSSPHLAGITFTGSGELVSWTSFVVVSDHNRNV